MVSEQDSKFGFNNLGVKDPWLISWEHTWWQGRRNFEKEEEWKKDPIICFECKKLEHIKVDCPKLKKNKKSSKEKFKKFKEAIAAWGESEDDSIDNETSDQEVANMCLVAKEDDINEIHFESNSYNNLQDDYNDLYEESLKLVNKTCELRKQVVSLTNEIELSKKHVDELTTKNNELNAKILDLTTCLIKFTKGQKNLNLLLGSQKCVYVKPLPSITHKIPCTFCNSNGHTRYTC